LGFQFCSICYKTGAQADATTCQRQFALAVPMMQQFITN